MTPPMSGWRSRACPADRASTGCGLPRSTSTRSPPSSAPPSTCALTRPSYSPRWREGCRLCLGCRRLGRWHELDRLLPGHRPTRQVRPHGPAAGCQPPPIILALTGRRSGDTLRTTDGSCPSSPPRSVASLGGLGGPAVWLDPVPAKQLHQALDLAMESLVLLDDRLKVHPGRPCPLPPRQPPQQLLLGVAQRWDPLEVLRLKGGLLLPPHLGELLHEH